jgi:hypothetical protein
VAPYGTSLLLLLLLLRCSPVGKEADLPFAEAILHVAAQLCAVPGGVQPVLHSTADHNSSSKFS